MSIAYMLQKIIEDERRVEDAKDALRAVNQRFNVEVDTEKQANKEAQLVHEYGPSMKPTPVDMVNQPPHYRAGDTYETIRVIEAWNLGFNLGNAVKYISRWQSKGGVEDLKKARWYLDREIAKRDVK